MNKQHGRQDLHLTLPATLIAALDAERAELGWARDTLVEQALREYLMGRHDLRAMRGDPPDPERIALYQAARLVTVEQPGQN